MIRRGEVCRSTSAVRRAGGETGRAGEPPVPVSSGDTGLRASAGTAAPQLATSKSVSRHSHVFCRLVLMETSLRSRDTCTPAGSACMFRNQGREAPSAQSGGFAGYPRAGHPYKNMCIHAQTLKSNK